MLSQRISLGIWMILGAVLLVHSSQLLRDRMNGIEACLRAHPDAAIFYLDDGDSESLLLDKGQLVVVDTPRDEPLRVPGYPGKQVIEAPYLQNYTFGLTFLLTEYGQWWGCMIMVISAMLMVVPSTRESGGSAQTNPTSQAVLT